MHSDLHGGNMLVDLAARPPTIAIIDWEGLRGGNRAADLGYYLLNSRAPPYATLQMFARGYLSAVRAVGDGSGECTAAALQARARWCGLIQRLLCFRPASVHDTAQARRTEPRQEDVDAFVGRLRRCLPLELSKAVSHTHGFMFAMMCPMLLELAERTVSFLEAHPGPDSEDRLLREVLGTGAVQCTMRKQALAMLFPMNPGPCGLVIAVRAICYLKLPAAVAHKNAAVRLLGTLLVVLCLLGAGLALPLLVAALLKVN